MKKFEEIKFDLPVLKGISAKNIEEHLKLYAGYVKNSNLILEKIEEMPKDAEKNAYATSELQRRFGFEFCGMRNHEYYFRLLEGGAKSLDDKSPLREKITETWGSFENWLTRFKTVATTRGIGWAVLFYDPQTKSLLNAWVDEHHLGNLSGLSFIMGIDMWEHSFMIDYLPSQKKEYISAFFENINWDVAEENFKKIMHDY
ncbi:MAG: Manganese/iron superoxide dismutase-like protein [Parcubacteria group bacterium GW2011_GWA1_40_21]|nr:MAG: Manganese/iron superoxide dismutase-like protein [Parcubacteria group bacterium GW2011_GWC1_40_13]KKR53631.1 MAG: Manganese/iron superoxide dismutase-like protein [Parcubacteria group bacterium GW2011_GWA1_40_21]